MSQDLHAFLLTFAVVVLGGYLGALADRFSYWFHVSRSLLWRRHCPDCFSPQAWITAVPVCGYVMQRGVCSSCKAILPLSSIVTELLGAATAWGLFATVFQNTLPEVGTDWLRAIFLLVTLVGVLVLAISDLAYDEVPVGVYALTLATLIFSIFLSSGFDGVTAAAEAGLLAGAVMYLLALVSHFRWVHAHDILLGILVGCIVGWPAVMLTLAFTYIFAVMGGLLYWGFKLKVYRGASSFGLYLFIALALQGILSAMYGSV